MKSLFVMLLVLGLLAGALFVPVGGRSFWARAQARGLPAAVARGAAHGMRAGWDFVASLGDHRQPTAEGTAHSPPKHPSRKAQAAAPGIHRASRDGIVAQAPKERIEQIDRSALDALVKGRAR